AQVSSTGGSAPASTAAGASAAVGSGGAAANDALYQKAKAEGQVVWNSATAEDIFAPVIQSFETTYPGVKVAFATVKPGDITTNVRVQQAAHKVSIDVAQSGELDFSAILNEHLPDESIDWTKLGVPANQVAEKAFMAYSSTPTAWIYNTQKVTGADIPKSWDDVLDPKWQGKIAVDGRGTFMGVFAAIPELGQDKGLEFARKLAAQKPLFQSSQSAVEPMVISGQVLIGTDVVSSFLAAQKKGAPIEIAPISPIHASASFAYVPNGAPHPNAAQLLVSWLGSPAGQAELDKAGYSALGSCSDSKQSTLTAALCSRNLDWSHMTQRQQFDDMAPYLQKVQQAFGTYSGK